MQMVQTTMFGVRGERVRRRRTARRDGVPHLDGRGRHENSLAARADVRLRAALTGRRAQIAAWLAAHGPATDRQVRDGLYGPSADMNTVRPRITELLDAGALREAGRVADELTGLTVRRVAVTGAGDGGRGTENAEREMQP